MWRISLKAFLGLSILLAGSSFTNPACGEYPGYDNPYWYNPLNWHDRVPPAWAAEYGYYDGYYDRFEDLDGYDGYFDEEYYDDVYDDSWGGNYYPHDEYFNADFGRQRFGDDFREDVIAPDYINVDVLPGGSLYTNDWHKTRSTFDAWYDNEALDAEPDIDDWYE